jgi:hypothetical protein
MTTRCPSRWQEGLTEFSWSTDCPQTVRNSEKLHAELMISTKWNFVSELSAIRKFCNTDLWERNVVSQQCTLDAVILIQKHLVYRFCFKKWASSRWRHPVQYWWAGYYRHVFVICVRVCVSVCVRRASERERERARERASERERAPINTHLYWLGCAYRARHALRCIPSYLTSCWHALLADMIY